MDTDAELALAYQAFAARDYADAGARASRVLRVAPDDPGALTLIGRLALLHREPFVAREAFGRVLARRPDVAPVWLDMARALRDLGLHRDALTAAQRACALAPNDAAALVLRGEIQLTLGEHLDAAAEAFRRALDKDPTLTGAFRGLCQVSDVDVDGRLARDMEALASSDRLQARARAEMHYALAQLHRRSGDDSRFIEHLLTANALQRSVCTGDRNLYTAVFDRLETVFTHEALAAAARADPITPTPIFIVGMPRSGTTLLERVVASHPDVAAGGELDYVRGPLTRAIERATGLPFPERFERLTQPEMTVLAQSFAQRLAVFGGGRRYVTDKTPGNFHVLGLLPILFPGARIVHLSRDPLDTCFSILQYPFDDRAPHTCDMELLAYVYARYARLMRRWRQLCPDAFIEIEYERFVASPTAEGRRVFDYCDLAWDDAYLDPQRSGGAVRTFSTAQVRRPIYPSSVGASRAYAKALEPLQQALTRELATVAAGPSL